MRNLQFLDNVVHQGITLKKGMIVSDAQQGLAEVGQNLIDRKLAIETDLPATHTAALVNGASEPIAIGDTTTASQAPAVEADEARKAAATAAQVPASPEAANAVIDEANKEAEVVNKGSLLDRAKAIVTGNPTPEQIAATAAQVQ